MTTDATELGQASLYFLLLLVYRELREDDPDTDSLCELLELAGFGLEDLEAAKDQLISLDQAKEEVQS